MKLPVELIAYLSGLEEILARMTPKERKAYIEAIRANQKVSKEKKSRSTSVKRQAGKLRVKVKRRRVKAKAED